MRVVAGIYLSIFSIFLPLSAQITIICNFTPDGNWWVIEGFYYCTVANKLNITSPDNRIITAVEGNHSDQFSLENVQGFEAENSDVFYFPKELEKFFKNLVMIDINYGPLKEIHQSDLRPFPKLKCLELYHNDIEVLESGLFDFNPDLEMIWMSSNKIFHIEPTIFNHLIGKLRYFSLSSNECISRTVKNSTIEAAELVKNISKSCVDPKIYADKILTKIERLEVKFEIFEKNFGGEKEKLVESEVGMTTFAICVSLVLFGGVLGVILWKYMYERKNNAWKNVPMAFENIQIMHSD